MYGYVEKLNKSLEHVMPGNCLVGTDLLIEVGIQEVIGRIDDAEVSF